MPRQFTEEEAQRVFARLAELQGQGHGSAGTLSLDELREAARAAGLDASLVERAVTDLDAAPERRRTLLSAPVEVTQTRVVPGGLDDDTWASMVTAIRSEFGAVGIAGELGRTREWTHISGGNKNGVTTRISAEPTSGGTRITISRSVRDSMMGFFIAGGLQLAMSVLFFAMAGLGVEADLWIPGVMMLAMGALFLGGNQIGTRIWARRRSEQFDRLLDRLDLVARNAASDESRPEPRRPALDLDALDEAPDADRASRRARDRS